MSMRSPCATDTAFSTANTGRPGARSSIRADRWVIRAAKRFGFIDRLTPAYFLAPVLALAVASLA